MKTRIISGCILAVILAAAIIGGGTALYILSLLIGLQGCFELYKITGISKNKASWIAYVIIAAYYAAMNIWGFSAPYLMLATLVILSIHVFAFPKFRLNKPVIAILGVTYPGLMSSCLYLCRRMEDGLFYCVLIIVCSLCTDVFAYFTGIKWGKHHPFKLLSPKKSIEGCVGGIIGTGILSSVIAIIFHKNVLVIVLISILGAVCSMIGDLSASSFKRENNIKDYSFIIPGHGGIMDRFDSVFFTGVIVYICVKLLF